MYKDGHVIYDNEKMETTDYNLKDCWNHIELLRGSKLTGNTVEL